MKKILVAISDSFPYGAAYAARTRALCKLFQSAGFETDVLCDWISDGGNTKEYGNIYCVSKTPYSGFKKLFRLPCDYVTRFETLVSENKYDYIVARSMFDRFGKLLAAARKQHVPIVLESCEWYDIKGFRRGKLDIRHHQFQHCFKKTYNRVDGVIAISRLLEDHYKAQGLPVIRIPGIHDMEKLPFRTEVVDAEGLNLVFGGNVFGGKEQFSDLLVALHRVRAQEHGILLHVYGSSQQEVLASLSKESKDVYDQIADTVIFHGRVPQTEMAKACLGSDFGVFFRPDRRSSHAGFPTKLGEYLAAGTPVITNDTGDISLVLRDGENGFLTKDASAESIASVLEKSLGMSAVDRSKMRQCARDTAVRILHYTAYDAEIKTFLDAL